jgi:hypothetical protein
MTKRLYRVTLNPENDCKVDQSAPRWLCQIALGLVSRSSCQIMIWQIWMEGSGNPQHRPLRTIWGAQFGETTESSQRLFKSGAWSNQTMLSRFEPWSESLPKTLGGWVNMFIWASQLCLETLLGNLQNPIPLHPLHPEKAPPALV